MLFWISFIIAELAIIFCAGFLNFGFILTMAIGAVFAVVTITERNRYIVVETQRAKILEGRQHD